MQSRKLISVMLFMVIGICFGYSDKYHLINGVWDDVHQYEEYSEKGSEYLVPIQKYSWGTGQDIASGYGIVIDINDDGKGIYAHYDTLLEVVKVEETEKNSDTVYLIHVKHADGNIEIVKFYIRYDGQEPQDIAFVESPIYPLCRSRFYRICSAEKMTPKHAVVNESNVRLRMAPNYYSTIITKYSKGVSVYVLDKYEWNNDGRNECWYKVRRYGFPDGWMFGKYVTITEDKKLNSR